MIILVGANGFLGRHCCELLERQRQPALAVSRNPDLDFFGRFAPSLRVMDVATFSSDEARNAIAEAQAIVYLAWRSVPSTFIGEPWREVPENVQGAVEFFTRVAKISPKTKIILLSSGGTVSADGTAPRADLPTQPTRPGLGADGGGARCRPYRGRPMRSAGLDDGRWQRADVPARLRAIRDGSVRLRWRHASRTRGC